MVYCKWPQLSVPLLVSKCSGLRTQDVALILQITTHQQSSDTSDDETTEIISPNSQSKADFYTKLAKFYQTLLFWLDEPRLHDANLYLPALPQQYGADRLVKLFQVRE